MYYLLINYFLKNYAVSINGMVEKMFIDGMTAGDVERKYREYLGAARQIVADKMVLDGPHKSDFGMFNNALKLPVRLTSTGQQKMALFDLILAHAKLIHAKKNTGAIILLDEAIAHLDECARKMFFDAIDATEAQVWYTGIDANLFKYAKNAKIMHEYSFYDEINNVSGVIDLLLVYEDHIDIVDFKLSHVDDEAYERLVAERIAEGLSNIITEMKDIGTGYNDLGYYRAYDPSDLVIVWNAEWVHKLRKVGLPTIFNKDGLLEIKDENVLRAMEHC